MLDSDAANELRLAFRAASEAVDLRESCQTNRAAGPANRRLCSSGMKTSASAWWWTG
jgi:hypothetical protein